MECEGGKVYNPCASACPATCADSDTSNECPGACIETCECPEGTLLDGNTCIAPSQCGCSQDGFYYSVSKCLAYISDFIENFEKHHHECLSYSITVIRLLT